MVRAGRDLCASFDPNSVPEEQDAQDYGKMAIEDFQGEDSETSLGFCHPKSTESFLILNRTSCVPVCAHSLLS